jgi:DNA-binding FrmR family transcriptional regulator
MPASDDVKHNLYCVDITNQIAGVQSAREQVSFLLMENHLHHCVTEAIREGKGDEKIHEIMDVVRYYTKAETFHSAPQKG